MVRFLCLLLITGWAVSSASADPGSFKIRNGHFELNGEPYRILSGEMHYPRVPRAYWRLRFRAARAMGLNSITTYVFWNVHELSPGIYDFSGNNDVAEYIREAQAEGLNVILRPGPYVCAEWELGGLPSWLLKDRSLTLRSNDPKFMSAVKRWFARLGAELAPLQLANGGPIIAIQVENEYGAFGSDHDYIAAIRQALVESGFGQTLFYTADNPDSLEEGSLSDLLIGLNFGLGDAPDSLQSLQAFRPDNPFFVSEYWAGWFDDWGDSHHTTDVNAQANELGWMLSQGASISFYMFHGGTSFGWMSGAGSDTGLPYVPLVTSYDYDAPLSEAGRVTPKYLAFRAAIANANATLLELPPVPADLPSMAIPEFGPDAAISLWDALPQLASRSAESADPLTMEDLDQAYGFILYRKDLSGPTSSVLKLNGLNDYAQIYIDQKLAGTLDLRLAQDQIPLAIDAGTHRLDILVENSGRVNYGDEIQHEQKGIRGQVMLGSQPLRGWRNISLPLADAGSLHMYAQACSGPCFYRARFDGSGGLDTFLDTSELSKGFVWVENRPLGRFWKIGPQRSLFLPGPWLKPGMNSVTVLDLEGKDGWRMRGLH